MSEIVLCEIFHFALPPRYLIPTPAPLTAWFPVMVVDQLTDVAPDIANVAFVRCTPKKLLVETPPPKYERLSLIVRVGDVQGGGVVGESLEDPSPNWSASLLVIVEIPEITARPRLLMPPPPYTG